MGIQNEAHIGTMIQSDDTLLHHDTMHNTTEGVAVLIRPGRDQKCVKLRI